MPVATAARLATCWRRCFPYEAALALGRVSATTKRPFCCRAGVREDGERKERSELRAAAAVAYVLDAKLIRRDLPGEQQTRDFDLVFSNDRDPEPLEVTTFASRPDLETWERLKRLGRELPAPELRNVWDLDVGPALGHARSETLDVRRIAREVVPALAALEAAGYRTIEYGQIDRDPEVGDALRRLIALGVDAGFATAPLEGMLGRVTLTASVGGFRYADLVAEGIEAEASKSDNQKKLTEPPKALRRHLVVVFDGSSGASFMAVYHGSKGRLPRLPSPITTAWACASGSLLATTPPNRWEHHRVPERVFDVPEDWLIS